MKQYNNTTIQIVFFGTHDFAATILEGLINSPFISVDLVITQPDKPVGRSRRLESSPVKKFAQKNNIEVIQPSNLKSYVLNLTPYTLGVTAQYGSIIPKEMIDAPKYGIMNVHTSLLPKYRGASPIQSALINGDTETGVTIMKMDEGLDTGPIILQKSVKIDPDDMYLDLDKKLAQIGSQALLEAIPKYISGELKPINQNDSQKTVCKQLAREDGRIDWSKSATEIYNQYRGMTPWPGVWTMWEGKRLKLIKIKPAELKLETGKVSAIDDKMYIGCGKESVEVFELQVEGKKMMGVKNFLNGFATIQNAELK